MASTSASPEGPRHDELLASFQDFTGIDDVAASMQFLENCRWNLQEAVETALAVGGDWCNVKAASTDAAVDTSSEDVEMVTAQDTNSGSAEQEPEANPFRGLLPQNNDVDDIYLRQPPLELDSYAASTGVARRRILNFSVTYCGKVYEFSLRDDETIGDLKRYIAKELAPTAGQLQPKHMELRGWRASEKADDVVLNSLHLPTENAVHLLTPGLSPSSHFTNGRAAENKSVSSRQYRLDVYDKENDRTHQLTVPGSKTVGDVKRDVYDLTNLPPSRQAWTGWPLVKGKLEDCLKVSSLNLDTPVHRLRVERSAAAAAPVQVDHSSDSSDNEEESVDVADDSMVIDESHLSPAPAHESNDQVPLIPADFSSHREAMENFLRVYEARYGDSHPVFSPSSLEDAIRDSCQVKPNVRKPLLIYLHDDGSVSANVFATQVLCSPAVVEVLNQNFIVWAWDCSLPENKNKFLLSLSTLLGSPLAYELRQLERDRYPVLLFVHKAKGSLEMDRIVKAPCSLDELMSELVHALDAFAHQNRLDIVDEEEREARERMRSEQENAYQASLNADRMKAEQKKLEEERLKAEQRSKEEEAVKQQKERQQLADELPPEPAESARAITIRIRLPTAEIIERRFGVQEKLATLLKFAASKGYKSGKYRLVTSYPKRDLTSMDAGKSFEELKLCPRETVFMEEV